jgi:acyl carrier protein
MNREECEALVLGYCREVIHPSIERDTRLLDEGLIDSFHTLALVTRLEEELGIRVELTDVRPEDVADVPSLAALVLRLQGEQAV